MAHFRAYVKGSRGPASRLGSATSGLYARLQTFGFDLVVSVRADATTDWAEVSIVPHFGGTERVIADVNLTTGKAYARDIIGPYTKGDK